MLQITPHSYTHHVDTASQHHEIINPQSVNAGWSPPRKITPAAPTNSSYVNQALPVLNKIAADATATVGAAAARGVSPMDPLNLAMTVVPTASEAAAHTLSDHPRAADAVRTATQYLVTLGPLVYAGVQAGSGDFVGATYTVIGTGINYLTQDLRRKMIDEGCKELPQKVQIYGKPWLQATGQIVVAGAIKAVETATDIGTVHSPQMVQKLNHTAEGNGTCSGAAVDPLANTATGSYRNDSTAQQQTTEGVWVQHPAINGTSAQQGNHTLTAQNVNEANIPSYTESIETHSAYLLPTAMASSIHNYTEGQIQTRLTVAASNHETLKQCPKKVELTTVGGSVQPLQYLSTGTETGWVALPDDDRLFYYQVFMADSDSSVVTTGADGFSVPTAHLVRQALTALNQTGEMPTQGEQSPWAKQSTEAGDRVKIQPSLDPVAIASEIRNNTIVVLKPCNPDTQQPEAPVVVLSTHHNQTEVMTNVGTEGWKSDTDTHQPDSDSELVLSTTNKPKSVMPTIGIKVGPPEGYNKTLVKQPTVDITRNETDLFELANPGLNRNKRYASSNCADDSRYGAVGSIQAYCCNVDCWKDCTDHIDREDLIDSNANYANLLCMDNRLFDYSRTPGWARCGDWGLNIIHDDPELCNGQTHNGLIYQINNVVPLEELGPLRVTLGMVKNNDWFQWNRWCFGINDDNLYDYDFFDRPLWINADMKERCTEDRYLRWLNGAVKEQYLKHERLADYY